MVAYDFESNTNDWKSSNKKQIPSITTQLTKELWFCNKLPLDEPTVGDICIKKTNVYLSVKD